MAEALFEAIASFVLDVVLTGIFYWPGWLFLRIVTLGHYPPQNAKHNEVLVSLVGLSVPLVLLTVTYLPRSESNCATDH
jgi:hypothetical protein